MKKSRGLWGLKWMKQFLNRLCKEHPRIYTAGYLGSFALLVAAGAAAPFLIRSIVYPVCTKQSVETGIIEEVVKREETIPIFGTHGRTNTYFKYQFVIDGVTIRVPPKDYRNYEEGDWYSCFLYTRNGKQVGDCHDYKLWQGLLFFGLTIIILVISMSFLFTKTSKEEIAKREEMEKIGQEAPGRPKFDHFSTRELYEQCLSEGITVPKGKSRNRKYLMNCLMGIHETKVYRYRSVLKEHRQRKVMDVFFVVFLLVMAVNYMRHGFYLFHLLFR